MLVITEIGEGYKYFNCQIVFFTVLGQCAIWIIFEANIEESGVDSHVSKNVSTDMTLGSPWGGVLLSNSTIISRNGGIQINFRNSHVIK